MLSTKKHLKTRRKTHAPRMQGNKFCHLILRGGDGAPNYDARNVAAAVQVLQASGVSDKVMIDCSHANSSKKYQNQPLVCSDVVCAHRRWAAGMEPLDVGCFVFCI
jgi:phospho-2-dehydro-3-deoxyheptonate aldolase